MSGRGAPPPARKYGTGIVGRSDLNKAAASVTAELQQIAHLQQEQDDSGADAKQV